MFSRGSCLVGGRGAEAALLDESPKRRGLQCLFSRRGSSESSSDSGPQGSDCHKLSSADASVISTDIGTDTSIYGSSSGILVRNVSTHSMDASDGLDASRARSREDVLPPQPNKLYTIHSVGTQGFQDSYTSYAQQEPEAVSQVLRTVDAFWDNAVGDEATVGAKRARDHYRSRSCDRHQRKALPENELPGFLKSAAVPPPENEQPILVQQLNERVLKVLEAARLEDARTLADTRRRSSSVPADSRLMAEASRRALLARQAQKFIRHDRIEVGAAPGEVSGAVGGA